MVAREGPKPRFGRVSKSEGFSIVSLIKNWPFWVSASPRPILGSSERLRSEAVRSSPFWVRQPDTKTRQKATTTTATTTTTTTVLKSKVRDHRARVDRARVDRPRERVDRTGADRARESTAREWTARESTAQERVDRPSVDRARESNIENQIVDAFKNLRATAAAARTRISHNSKQTSGHLKVKILNRPLDTSKLKF